MKQESDNDWLTRKVGFHGISLSEDDVEYFLERCAILIESAVSANPDKKFDDIVKGARNTTLRSLAARLSGRMQEG